MKQSHDFYSKIPILFPVRTESPTLPNFSPQSNQTFERKSHKTRNIDKYEKNKNKKKTYTLYSETSLHS